MKIVRISNGIVQEIIPVAAAPVESWYGAAFAALCVEAPDEVEQNWIYDRETGSFFRLLPNRNRPDPPRRKYLRRKCGLLSARCSHRARC